MPSGPKKRRAAKKKNQGKSQKKQTDEVTSVSVVKVTIPVEELTKGAVWHETASVDKELDKSKNIVGQVSDEFKIASVVEGNEVSLLDVTSNMDNVVSSDEPLVNQNAGGEILQGNESCGVDSSVTELLLRAPEQNFEQGHRHEMSSDAKMPGEILKMEHDLLSGNDTTTLDTDKNRGFLGCDVPVVVPSKAFEVQVLAGNEAASVSKEEIAKHTVQDVSDGVKDVSVLESSVKENEEVLFKAAASEDCEVSKYEAVVPQNADFSFECTSKDTEPLSVGSPEGKDTAPLPSVTLTAFESNKEPENSSYFSQLLAVVPPEEMTDTNLMPSNESNVSEETGKTSMFHDHSIAEPEANLGSFLPGFGLLVVLDQPSSNEHVKEDVLSGENTGCSSAEIPFVSEVMLAVPKSVVSVANENQVTEVPSDSKEMLVVPTETVPPTIGNQVYIACPMHCKSECSFPQLLRGQLMDSVVELKSAVLSLKNDLQKALEKLDAISY
ncbi:hypothetical protein HAX54_009307 [Datura stramonium]|uniref:Uncharacterized protein n=1 Tax=Datura stramonium TaxID=4076 RepID=A0ABS8TEK7_DATST|nr:hypothetical protein [Datura stramonium]